MSIRQALVDLAPREGQWIEAEAPNRGGSTKFRAMEDEDGGV